MDSTASLFEAVRKFTIYLSRISRHYQLTQFHVRQFQNYAFIKKTQKNTITVYLKARRNFPCRNENAVRGSWQKNTAGRQHRWWGGCAVACQVPVYWSLDSNWIPLCIRTYTVNHMPNHLPLARYSACPGSPVRSLLPKWVECQHSNKIPPLNSMFNAENLSINKVLL